MNSTKAAALVLWLALPCLMGFGILVMKNQVQNLENELVHLNKDIQDDIKTIHVLKAEWSHLNSPSRLRQLATKHISLNQVRAEQIINYSALPFNYEKGDSDRQLAARKKIADYAEQNRGLKRLVKVQQ